MGRGARSQRSVQLPCPALNDQDTKAITASRVRLVDPSSEAGLVKALHDLAKDVFVQFNLTSLVRLDIRADRDGNLFILVSRPLFRESWCPRPLSLRGSLSIH